MRLLVTGASGYLGSEIVRQALARGLEVVACARDNDPPGGVVERLDVRGHAAVEQLFAKHQPDAVIHAAYVQEGEEAWSTNVDGTLNVAYFARGAGVAFAHLSTDQVFDGERGHYSEDDEPNPVSDYGKTKHASELAALEAHPAPLIARSALLYGGELRSPHERLALEVAQGKAQARFFTDEVRSPIAVQDAAGVLLDLITSAHTGVVHLGGPEAMTRYELARAIAGTAGHDVDAIEPGSAARSGLLRPRNTTLDSSRVRGLVPTRIRSVAEVLGAAARSEGER